MDFIIENSNHSTISNYTNNNKANISSDFYDCNNIQLWIKPFLSNSFLDCIGNIANLWKVVIINNYICNGTSNATEVIIYSWDGTVTTISDDDFLDNTCKQKQIPIPIPIHGIT